MLSEGSRSAQSFFRVTESKRTSQREKTTMSHTFRNHSQSSPRQRTSGCRWLPPPLPQGTWAESHSWELVCVPCDLREAWDSGWGCSLPRWKSLGPGGRSKNASSRRSVSALSSVSGKSHFLTVGLGYPICKERRCNRWSSRFL